jgi:putative transposase
MYMKSFNPKIHHRKTIRLKGYDYSQEGFYFLTICCQNRTQLFGEIIDGKMILNDAGEIANQSWSEIPTHFPNVVLHEFVIMPNHVHGIIELKGIRVENLPPPNNNENGYIVRAENLPPPDNNENGNIVRAENLPPPDNNENGNIVRAENLPPPDNNENGNIVRAENLPPTTTTTANVNALNDYENINGTDVDGNGAKNFSPLRSPSKTIGSVVRGFKIGVTKWMRKNTDVVVVWQRNYYEHIIRNEHAYKNISNYIETNPQKWNQDKFFKK